MATYTLLTVAHVHLARDPDTKDKTNKEILTDLRNQKPRILTVKKLQKKDIRIFTTLQTERDRLLKDLA